MIFANSCVGQTESCTIHNYSLIDMLSSALMNNKNYLDS